MGAHEPGWWWWGGAQVWLGALGQNWAPKMACCCVRRAAGASATPPNKAACASLCVQAHRLGDELALAGVPYVVSGGAAFWARAEVKDALSMLRVAAKPRDQAAIKRFLGGGGAALCKGLGARLPSLNHGPSRPILGPFCLYPAAAHAVGLVVHTWSLGVVSCSQR